MDDRFRAVRGSAQLVMGLGGIAAAAGLLLLLYGMAESSSGEFFVQVSSSVQAVLGGTLLVYGLVGLLLAGAVQLLLDIRDTLHRAITESKNE